MKKLLKFLKAYKKEAVLAPLFKLLEASFELLVPLVIASMISNGIDLGQAGTNHVLKMGGLLLLLAVVGLIASVTAQYFAAKAAVGFAADMKQALFAHMQRFSFVEIDTMGTSSMITRMTSDANQVQNGVNMVLRLFLRSPFIVVGAMVMAFTVDVKAALVFVVVIPILMVVVLALILYSIPTFHKVQKRMDGVMGITRENLSGVRVIRAFHKEEEELREFGERNDALVKFQLFAGRISALMNPLTYVIINVALAVLIWKGAIQVDAGYLKQAQVIALVNYMSQILVELIKFANLIITITKAIASGNRIQAVFEMEPTLKVPAKEAGGVRWEEIPNQADIPFVEMKDVSFAYAGAAENSLTDISFAAKKGETIGIIGGTGSGKSTLIHLLAHFYDATKGTVAIKGVPVEEINQKDLRRKISVVLQKAVLFEGTIRSNLLWGNEHATEEELQRAVSIAQAAEVVDGKEQGLDSEVEQGGRNFSGGQRQRLCIARALTGHPEILILDDSSSALDYATDARLRKALQSLKEENITIFIISQRTASVRQADHILVLDDGGIAGWGTHEELMKSCELYREIHQSQNA